MTEGLVLSLAPVKCHIMIRPALVSRPRLLERLNAGLPRKFILYT